MRTIFLIGKITVLAVAAIIAGMLLYALPATLLLPTGLRPGIKNLTLADAAQQLADTGKTGEDLVEGELALTPLSKVLNHTPFFRLLTQWGEAAVNAHRYYRTGKDSEL